MTYWATKYFVNELNDFQMRNLIEKSNEQELKPKSKYQVSGLTFAFILIGVFWLGAAFTHATHRMWFMAVVDATIGVTFYLVGMTVHRKQEGRVT